MFNEDHKKENEIEVDIRLQPGLKFFQQKSRSVPVHLQPELEKELNINDNCFKAR